MLIPGVVPAILARVGNAAGGETVAALRAVAIRVLRHANSNGAGADNTADGDGDGNGDGDGGNGDDDGDFWSTIFNVLTPLFKVCEGSFVERVPARVYVRHVDDCAWVGRCRVFDHCSHILLPAVKALFVAPVAKARHFPVAAVDSPGEVADDCSVLAQPPPQLPQRFVKARDPCNLLLLCSVRQEPAARVGFAGRIHGSGCIRVAPLKAVDKHAVPCCIPECLDRLNSLQQTTHRIIESDES